MPRSPYEPSRPSMPSSKPSSTRATSSTPTAPPRKKTGSDSPSAAFTRRISASPSRTSNRARCRRSAWVQVPPGRRGRCGGNAGGGDRRALPAPDVARDRRARRAAAETAQRRTTPDFFHVVPRLEIDGHLHTSWQEVVERTVRVTIGDLRGGRWPGAHDSVFVRGVARDRADFR